MKKIAETLIIADQLEAVCCATVAGSFDGSGTPCSHVGHHPENFGPKAFEEVVQWVRHVLDEVKPIYWLLALTVVFFFVLFFMPMLWEMNLVTVE